MTPKSKAPIVERVLPASPCPENFRTKKPASPVHHDAGGGDWNPEDFARQQAILRGRHEAQRQINQWKRTHPELPLDEEGFRGAVIRKFLEDLEAEQARQAAERAREKELRASIEAREQAERQQAVESLVGRLTAEELAGRLLDLVGHCQRCRINVPVGLLA
jgi:cytosine/adenosine deaminase-related metal-dependent hydrolase